MSKTFTQNNLSTATAKRELDKVIRRYLEDLGTPRSLTVWMLYKYNEHDQLVDLDFDINNYRIEPKSENDGIERVFSDYAATNLLSKADFLSTSFDKTARALEKFLESERKCRSTNDRLLGLNDHDRE